MAATSDVRAAGFDAAKFRSAIKFAMDMAKPNATSAVATFSWEPVRSYGIKDQSGTPYDLSAAPLTTTTTAPKVVSCAVEFAPSDPDLVNGMGQFSVSRGVITIIDTDYPTIKGADYVLINGSRYNIIFWRPPIGLFGVDVYEIEIEAAEAGRTTT